MIIFINSEATTTTLAADVTSHETSTVTPSVSIGKLWNGSWYQLFIINFSNTTEEFLNHHNLTVNLILGYSDVTSVKNSAKWDCSNDKGSLEWATSKCTETVNCGWIHDYNCDNKNWRFCFNIDVNDYIQPNEKACAKVKSGNTGKSQLQ